MYTPSTCIVDLTDAAFVSLTTDGWSQKTDSYITTTAHWVDSNCQLQSAVLQTTRLNDSHSAENLLEYLEKVLEQWGLSGTKPVITTDNASNMVKGLKDGGYVNIPCFAHTKNLAAQRGLKIPEVELLLGNIRKLVKFFNRSPLMSQVLLDN